jgi:TP901 family phage tail tape measure protein
VKKVLEVAVVLSAIDKMTAPIRNAANAAAGAMGKLSAQTQKLSEQSMAFGRGTLAAGAGMAAAFALPIKAAMEFETGMTNVRKVVDGLKDETAFKDFSQQVLQLGREIPLAYSELTDLVAAGGRMGIAKEHLITYAKETAKMATAFDMAAGDIGEKVGKLAVAFEIPITKIGSLGDAINYLDDNSISKGGDIIEVLSRMAGTARQVGMSAEQAAALGSTFLTLGSSAEVAGTASQAMLRELSLATMQPKKFQEALGELGLSAEKLQKQMSIDPQNTLLAVMDKLNKVAPEKQIEITTKLFGKEYGDDAAKLAKGVNEYRRQIGLLGKTELKGSMSREFEARMKTSAAQMALFKNNVTELAVTLGNALLPAFNAVLQAVKPYLDAFRDWAARNPELVESIAKVVAIAAALTLGLGALSFVFGGVLKVASLATGGFRLAAVAIGGLSKGAIWAVGKLRMLTVAMAINYQTGGILAKGWAAMQVVIGGVGKAFTFLGGVVKTITRIMMANPILAAVAAIAMAVYLIYEYWEPIKQFFIDLWEGIKSIFWGVIEWLKNFGIQFYETGKSWATSLWDGFKSAGDWINPMSYIGLDSKSIDDAFAAQELLNSGDAAGAAKLMNGTGVAKNFGLTVPSAVSSALPTPMKAGGKSVISDLQLMFSPNITINGTVTPEQEKGLSAQMAKYGDDLAQKFKEMQRQNDRKALQ